MTTPTADRDMVVRTIATWPIEDQVTLAQQILQRATAHTSAPLPPDRQQPSDLASTMETPSSDEESAQAVDYRAHFATARHFLTAPEGSDEQILAGAELTSALAREQGLRLEEAGGDARVVLARLRQRLSSGKVQEAE